MSITSTVHRPNPCGRRLDVTIIDFQTAKPTEKAGRRGDDGSKKISERTQQSSWIAPAW